VKAALITAGITLSLALGASIAQHAANKKENSLLQQENSSLRVGLSTRDLLAHSNAVIFQIQAATIQSYQLENAKLSRQIAGIEAERDPSATAVKKRTARLAGEIFDFLQQWRSSEPDRKQLNDAWLKSGEDFSKAFTAQADATMDLAHKMALEFARKFLGRLATTRDQLADLGITSDLLDHFIKDNVRTELEVQAAAEELQKLAEKIKE
jgi:hypothetical protein